MPPVGFPAASIRIASRTDRQEAVGGSNHFSSVDGTAMQATKGQQPRQDEPRRDPSPDATRTARTATQPLFAPGRWRDGPSSQRAWGQLAPRHHVARDQGLQSGSARAGPDDQSPATRQSPRSAGSGRLGRSRILRVVRSRNQTGQPRPPSHSCRLQRRSRGNTCR